MIPKLRNLLIHSLSNHLAGRAGEHPMLVAMDGLPGSGKTTLSKRLVADLQNSGVSCQRVGYDSFVNTDSSFSAWIGQEGPVWLDHDDHRLRRAISGASLRGHGKYGCRSGLTGELRHYHRLECSDLLVIEGSLAGISSLDPSIRIRIHEKPHECIRRISSRDSLPGVFGDDWEMYILALWFPAVIEAVLMDKSTDWVDIHVD